MQGGQDPLGFGPGMAKLQGGGGGKIPGTLDC